MGNLKLILFAIVTVIFFAGCGNNSDKKVTEKTNNTTQQQTTKIQEKPKEEPEFKIVSDSLYKKVVSNTNPNMSYAVYSPDVSKKLPVFVLFDPHADGSLPLTNYKILAKEFGFVLIASNNSMNGLQPQDYQNILSAFYQDLKNQFIKLIDTSAIFTGGFSGGGRVASIFASVYKIPVVCSAGAGVAEAKQIDFNFIGFVGNKDFNFMELYNLDDMLSNISKKDHYVEFFDGIHEWPPADVYKTAFYYMSFYLMRNKKMPVNNELISEFEKEIKAQISNAKRYIIKANLYKKLVVFENGLKDVSAFKKKYDEIISSKQYKVEQHEMVSIFDQENRLRSAYAGALLNKPLDWWKDKMKQFERNEKTMSADEALMYKRIRNYLSLATYMGITNYMKQGNYLYARQLLDVYKVIDPENKEIPNLEKELESVEQ
jgi:hypothetical protein